MRGELLSTFPAVLENMGPGLSAWGRLSEMYRIIPIVYIRGRRAAEGLGHGPSPAATSATWPDCRLRVATLAAGESAGPGACDPASRAALGDSRAPPARYACQGNDRLAYTRGELARARIPQGRCVKKLSKEISVKTLCRQIVSFTLKT
jgi:hypothetical protein